LDVTRKEYEVLENLKWWQKAVFYQIYPHSFADGNGDGISDFPGMTGKLDYLQDLGIDGIWLSPHYPSPFFDCGYDISDYTDVGPEYGTLDDFKRFLDAAHQREIRVILDMVLNHTSDQHGWFRESRSSRDNPKRDWYIWRDGINNGPPNNWDSTFGGSAWEYDTATGQYYYHFFFKEQPDLNWRNQEVVQAMWDAVRFWLDMGVDGFRLDAVGTVYENPNLPDHTGRSLLELQQEGLKAKTHEEFVRLEEEWKTLVQYQVDLPEVHDLMKELRKIVDEYEDRVLVGETDDIRFYGSGDDELHLAFNFPLMQADGELTPAWIRANQKKRLSSLPPQAWPCNTLGNHDNARVYSRYGEGKGQPHPHDAARARLSLALMLTLRGTPFLYNGEEIGMTDYYLSDPALFRDNTSTMAYPLLINLLGKSPEEALKIAAMYGRDKCRTPMQWANAPNGGFCPAEVTPWLPVNPNYAEGINVADQLNDPRSMLNFYKRMLQARRSAPALIAGDYTPLNEQAEDYLAFLRSAPAGQQTCLVVLSYSAQALQIPFVLPGKQARLVFSSHPRRDQVEQLNPLELEPFEIYIAELN
jgi:alpha-glucosidase